MEETKWNESNSGTFIDYGKYFVPERENQLKIITRLIPGGDGERNIIDLCCGEGILCAEILKARKENIVYGLDGSKLMKQRAEKNLENFGNRFKFQMMDIFKKDWRTPPYPVHAVASSLAIHHLDGEEKQELFKDIYAMLSEGGAFIIADVILPVNQSAMSLAAEGFSDAVKENALKHAGDLKAHKFFEDTGWNLFALKEPDHTDKPSPLYSQLKWLEEAGFKDIDVYWMRAGHVIFGGVK